MSIFIIAEIGINHNGDINLAKTLIDGVLFAGADAVKFQKRTVEKVYSKEELDRPRESPWGTTNRAQKLGLEFGRKEYDEIDKYCKERGIYWFASAWDLDSQDFLRRYDCRFNKIASPMLTNLPLLEKVAEEKKHTFISTGMSSLKEIETAVNIFRQKDCDFELMHCNSTYPMPVEKANLNVINTLRERFNCDVGYSGHEVGLAVSVAAAAYGITSLERHITKDRSMYGSDQAASVEIMGFHRLIRMVRAVEKAMGDGKKRILEEEKTNRKKLAPKQSAFVESQLIT